MSSPNRAVLFSLSFIALIIAGFAAYVWVALHWNYSEGERAGFMQKLSHKGWLCKTWEGELSLVALPGVAPEKFNFSVRDDAIAQQINALVGQRISLTYEQHKGLPTSCFGETEYFITAVKLVK